MVYASEAISYAAYFGSGCINRMLPAACFPPSETERKWYGEKGKLVSKVFFFYAGQLVSRLQSVNQSVLQSSKRKSPRGVNSLSTADVEL